MESDLWYVQMFMKMTLGNPFLQSWACYLHIFISITFITTTTAATTTVTTITSATITITSIITATIGIGESPQIFRSS